LNLQNRLVCHRHEIIGIFRKDQAAQTPDAAVKMAARQFLNAIGASRINQAKHVPMILKDVLNVAAFNDIKRTEARIAGLRPAHHLPEEMIVGCAEPDFMHGEVYFQEDVSRKAMRFRKIYLPKLLQLRIGKSNTLDIRRRTGLDEISENHALHRNALIDELIDDVIIEPCDNAALSRKNLNETVLLQALKHAAHRRARNGKTLAQIMLAEQITGFMIKAKYFFGKRLINLIVIADRLNCHTLIILKSDTVIIIPQMKSVNTTHTCFLS